MPEITADILTQLRNGDKRALQVLFEQYYGGVCQVISRFINDRALVEDLAQEVFIRFWEKREQIVISTSVQAYLRRMAINEALGWLRRHQKFTEEPFLPDTGYGGHDESAEEQFVQAEMRQSVTDAIDTLPPKCRTVFQLSRFEELTYQEIADQMGISIKTVENQMGKALKLLRERLSDLIRGG